MSSPPRRAPAARRSSYAKSAQTRTRILEAALAEASDAGIHKTSLTRIASRAGVAVGNLHYHFGSKRMLLRELMKKLVSDLLTRLYVAHPADSHDFFEHERVGLLVYLEYLRANPAYLRLVDEVKLHDPRIYRAAVQGWVDHFDKRIRRAIEHGYVRPMEESEIVAQAHFLLGTRHYLEHLLRVSGEAYPGDEVVVEHYVALIRGGLEDARPAVARSARSDDAAEPDEPAGSERAQRDPDPEGEGELGSPA